MEYIILAILAIGFIGLILVLNYKYYNGRYTKEMTEEERQIFLDHMHNQHWRF